MKYYFSGIGTFTGALKERLAAQCPYRLQSCHGSYVNSARDWAELAANNPGHVELMLDSGAFTAWSKGDKVELQSLIRDYSYFIDKYEHKMKAIWLINLDKIPGSPGRTATQTELQEAVYISDNNFKELVKLFGERVLPVFHQNESEQRLNEIIDMAPYVCVSPRNDLPEKSRVTWSQYVHTSKKDIKSHGLATTGAKMLTTVPWYSADSASWVFAGAMGSITVLLKQKLTSISISNESPDLKNFNKHFDTMSSLSRDYIEQRIVQHGFVVDEMKMSHGHRMAFNMLETLSWMDQLQVNSVSQKGLFDL